MLAEHRLDKRDSKKSGQDNRINRIATVVILSKEGHSISRPGSIIRFMVVSRTHEFPHLECRGEEPQDRND